MSDLSDYKDLGEWEQTHRYECQRCGHRTKDKFDSNDCPNCSRDGLYADRMWAREEPLVTHGPEGSFGIDRVVRL